MLTLLVSQDDWFVYRVLHVVIGHQGISMLGTVGICLLTSRHVLWWILGLHHTPQGLHGSKTGKIFKIEKVSSRGHQLFHPLPVTIDCHSQPEIEDELFFFPRDLKSGANQKFFKAQGVLILSWVFIKFF